MSARRPTQRKPGGLEEGAPATWRQGSAAIRPGADLHRLIARGGAAKRALPRCIRPASGTAR